MNAVDEIRRRTFESDWLRGSKRDISDYLPTPDDPSFLGTLEELICIDLEFRWREVASSATDKANSMATTLKSWPAVEDYLERFPQLKQPPILQRLLDQEIRARMRTPFRPTVAEYQRRFPDLETTPDTLQRLLREAQQETHYETPGAVRTTTLDRFGTFGKYELLEVLGRGGMGVVYRARQTQANRLVAIKIANLALHGPESRKEISQRFEAEIRAAAKVSHENVLPIYDVGQVDGSSYYTMPILSGDLAAEVRKQPLTNDRAARYVSQAARGVAAAHAAGLLHRDVKPHNLLLDDKADRVLVTDFGLARLAVVDQSFTRTGEIHGSPPYMAPEQIREPKDIDTRADIYSLGATLYHLLAGRPPFQAASPAETLLQSLEEDPISPRVLNRRIDRDLETICMRCLHKDRELRFASAADLADDLDRYLRHEPIVSRPLNSWERLMRWRRRNPTVALLSGSLVAALLLVGLVGLGGWYFTRLESNNTRRQLGRVIAGSKQSQAAVNEMYTFVQAEPLLDQPATEEIRHALLTKGLEHYTAFIALAEENDSLLVDRAAAQTQLGILSNDLKEPKAAAEHFEGAILAIAAFPPEKRTSPAVQENLGDAWNGLAQSQHQLREYEKALDSFDRAIEIRKQIVAKDENDFEAKRKLANSLMNHGLTLARTGNEDAARAEQEAAQRMRRELEGIDAKNRFLRRDLSQGDFNLARLDLTNDRIEAGLPPLRKATVQFKQLTDDEPLDVRNWVRYIESLMTLASYTDNAPLPDLDDARPPYDIAWESLDKLSSLAPNNKRYLVRLVELYQEIIEHLLRSELVTDAEQAWKDMQSRLVTRLDRLEKERLDKGDKSVDATAIRLKRMRHWGLILVGLGKKDEAKPELGAAIEAWHAAKNSPDGDVFKTPEWESEWTKLEKLANSL